MIEEYFATIENDSLFWNDDGAEEAVDAPCIEAAAEWITVYADEKHDLQLGTFDALRIGQKLIAKWDDLISERRYENHLEDMESHNPLAHRGLSVSMFL
jgi:hypothetical protein